MGHGRALVLGGGGVTGIAWEIGVLAGLAAHGVELSDADVIVGTSAGSIVGALLRGGAELGDLYARQLEAPGVAASDRIGTGAIARFVIAALWPGDGRRGRAYLGRAALAARTVPEDDRRRIIGSLLPWRSWPERRLLITAVDAESGEARVFDRESGVALADAVAASCAVPIVWPPITIQGRRYIDGGARSIANADLAQGCDRVVVVAPVTFAFRRSDRIKDQLAGLGPDVRSAVVSPDPAARRSIGRNVLDPARRRPAAEAGRRQADAAWPQVAAVWARG